MQAGMAKTTVYVQTHKKNMAGKQLSRISPQKHQQLVLRTFWMTIWSSSCLEDSATGYEVPCNGLKLET
jgi:hypothetical protein